MSKRKNDVSIPSYKDKGYLPEALRNYLCLLGWSHPEEKDIFDLQEFIQKFSMDRMVKSGPIFDIKKLQWMNGKYIREHLSEAELIERLMPYLPTDFPQEILPQVLPLIRDRLVTLSDIEDLTLFFYKDLPLHRDELIGKKGTAEDAKKYIEAVSTLLQDVDEKNWIAATMEEKVRDYCDAQGWNRGAFFMTLRVAVTSRSVTPPLFDTIATLGKKKTLQRLQDARTLLA